MKQNRRASATDAAIVMLCAAILLVLALGVVDRRGVVAPPCTVTTILIDAGHGGADGGAVAADGTTEKEINLSVALGVRDLLRVMGFVVNTTRDTDVMLSTEGSTLRERKVSDIKYRLSLVQQADLTVSIHQNKFEQEKYYGTQVFYSPNHPQSQEVAETVRQTVVSLLQPHNTRPLKKGSDDVYLLKHAETPMILVECGFLSNVAEREKLKTAEYQQELALTIGAGVLAAMGTGA